MIMPLVFEATSSIVGFLVNCLSSIRCALSERCWAWSNLVWPISLKMPSKLFAFFLLVGSPVPQVSDLANLDRHHPAPVANDCIRALTHFFSPLQRKSAQQTFGKQKCCTMCRRSASGKLQGSAWTSGQRQHWVESNN